MIFKPRESKNLSQWLEIATNGIAPAGKERITREIEAHYAEAIEAHLTRGEPEQVVQVKALAELGAPRAAAKRFRKQYLSSEDERFLNALHNRTFTNASGISCLILLPLMLYYSSQVEKYSGGRVVLFALALFMTCMLFPLLAYVQARRLSGGAATRWILMIDVSRWALLGLVATLVTWLYEGPFGFFAICSIWAIRRRLLAWKKISPKLQET